MLLQKAGVYGMMIMDIALNFVVLQPASEVLKVRSTDSVLVACRRYLLWRRLHTPKQQKQKQKKKKAGHPDFGSLIGSLSTLIQPGFSEIIEIVRVLYV